MNKCPFYFKLRFNHEGHVTRGGLSNNERRIVNKLDYLLQIKAFSSNKQKKLGWIARYPVFFLWFTTHEVVLLQWRNRAHAY